MIEKNRELYIMDRKEKDTFILENKYGKFIEVNSKFVFDNIKEGDVLAKINGKYYLDKAETENRRKIIENSVEGMWVDE